MILSNKSKMNSMNFEERKIKETFNVPDGYFKELHDSIMQQLPREKRQPIIRSIFSKKIVRLSYAAAITTLIVVGSALYYQSKLSNDYLNEEIIDDIYAYSPIDDYTFYCYLADIE